MVEIIGGEKPVVRRRNKTTRWDDFGEGCENTGIHSPLYFPSEPEYTALKNRLEDVKDSSPSKPLKGTLFYRDGKDVVHELINEDVECDFCEGDRPARLRVRAWRGDVYFGLRRTREETINELCFECINVVPDGDDVKEYRQPSDRGKTPVDFDEYQNQEDEESVEYEDIERNYPTRWGYRAQLNTSANRKVVTDQDEPISPVGDCDREFPDEPQKPPLEVLTAYDGDLTGKFKVYISTPARERDEDCNRNEYLLTANLYWKEEQVGGETASLPADSIDDVFRQARRIYSSYWSTKKYEIEWDEYEREELNSDQFEE